MRIDKEKISDMSQTIEIPNNIPVSWLSRQESTENDMLFLVSVPDPRTETEFMSKYLKYEDFYRGLYSDFKIGTITQWINKVSTDYAPILDNLSGNTICCATIPNPYIISAISQENGNITGLEGYRLSDGMDYIFKNVFFDQINCINLTATNTKLTNLSTTNANISSLTIENSTINNLSVSHITTVSTSVPSLYGYPLVEVQLKDSVMTVKNKCVNYGIVINDFSIVMEVVSDTELETISKDFEVFVYAVNDVKINFNQFQFTILTPNNEEEDVLQLEAGKYYLLIFSQVDMNTVYMNRQILRSIC